MKPYSDEWHRAFGLHSNIPECCVDYFVGTWRTRFDTERGRDYVKMTKSWKYIPCPECLAAKRIERLHYCDSSCPFPQNPFIDLRFQIPGSSENTKGDFATRRIEPIE
jgi:hypothetical protein